MKIFRGLIALLLVLKLVDAALEPKEILFTVQSSTNNKIASYSFDSNSTIALDICKNDKNFIILIHGWTEDIQSCWVSNLTKAFLKYRGGCLIFTEYSVYTTLNWFVLIRPDVYQFVGNAILQQVLMFKGAGFKSEQSIIFGHSYGARLAFLVGKKSAESGYKIGEIYGCDPAGPFFDGTALYIDPIQAGTNVQCIHTSSEFGTHLRDGSCHQNWILGNCGDLQPANNGTQYYRSHGLCPIIFTYSFKFKFLAGPNKYQNCPFIGKPGNYSKIGQYKLGPMQKNDGKMLGTFFVDTTCYAPYTYTLSKNDFQ